MAVKTFPTFISPENATLDTFLEHCQDKCIQSIDIYLHSGPIDEEESKSYDEINIVPLFIKYQGLLDGSVKIVRNSEKVGELCYEKTDHKFDEPVSGFVTNVEPLRQLKETGILHAQYCAQQGFDTRLFTNLNPIHNQDRKLIYQVTPDKAPKKPVTLPILAIL